MTKTNTLLVIFLLLCIQLMSQKVILQLDATPSSTPSVSKASLRYNKDFAYSFTLDDCSADHYAVAKPLFQGGIVPNSGYTSPGFFFTDGCGNNLPFKIGLAWNSTNTYGAGPNANDPNYMTWTQLQEVYNLGWDVINHSYAHRAWGDISGNYTYANQITQNNDAVRNHLGVEMPIFVAPSGDYNYHSVALQLGHKAIFDQNYPQGGVSFNGIQVDDNANMTELKGFRETIESQVDNATKLTYIANQSTGGTHLWYNEFGHYINNMNTSAAFNFYKFKDYISNLASVYGTNGSDRVWFAPLQEVYEYVVSRQNVNYNLSLTAENKLEITLNLSSVPTWLRRKTVTLVINSTANFSNVTLPQGITATWRGTGSTKLLNLDFTNYTPVVPVELVKFTATAKNTMAVLNWETAAERKFHGFEIEKSTDGFSYTPIGKINATGNGSKYSFEDVQFSKTSYYRLKMLDKDGTFDYSRVVSLLVASKFNVKITPSVSDETVIVETDFDDKTTATIEVYSQTGQLKTRQTASHFNTISIENLPQGLYFVRVNHGQDFWVKKIVKY
ncbi:MAG: polysaccharide deacetylase family protein [Saprospiraceae bacterium]|nr:polysaccharide deacetylase family protein [Saprospiraceae bacterium]